MDRHKVSTEPLVKATQILARNGYATARSLSLDIPCHLRTADRLVAYLKDTGDYVKQGYGIAPKDSATKIPPHSPTFRHKDSATPKESTTYKDSATSEHSATKIPPHSATNIPPSQLLSNTEAVQNGPRSGGAISNGAAADQVGFLLGMKASKASTSGSQKEIEEPAAPPLALRAAEGEEQQPWGPDENEQASLEYQEFLVKKHTTKEITGLGEAGASHRSVCDGGIDMAAYHADLDKLLGVLCTERDAWKLHNRQLGVARSKGNITRLELCRGKRNHNELLRVIHDLTADLESGELRYANLQAAGETLDITWNGWRQKMATDPELIQHYRDMIAQQSREARKEAWEAKRDAAQDLKDEIAATKPAVVQEPAAIGEANMLDDDTLTDEELDEAAWRQSIEEEQAGDPAACGTYGWVPILATQPVAVQELSVVVEVPATPAPPLRASVEQSILAMLAAAVNGRSVSLVTFRRELRDPSRDEIASRDEITGKLNTLVWAKKIVEEGQENGRTYRLPPPAEPVEKAVAAAEPVGPAFPAETRKELKVRVVAYLVGLPHRCNVRAAEIHAAIRPAMDVLDLDLLLQYLGCNGEIDIFEMDRREYEFRAHEPDEPLDAVEEPAVDSMAWLSEPRTYPACTPAVDDDNVFTQPGLPESPEFPDVQSLRAQDAQDRLEAAQAAQCGRDALNAAEPSEQHTETVGGPVTPEQVPVTAIDISSMPPGLSWPETVVEYVRRGGQDLVAIAAAIDQSLASIQNVVRFDGDIHTRYEHGRPHYYVLEPEPTVPVPTDTFQDVPEAATVAPAAAAETVKDPAPIQATAPIMVPAMYRHRNECREVGRDNEPIEVEAAVEKEQIMQRRSELEPIPGRRPMASAGGLDRADTLPSRPMMEGRIMEFIWDHSWFNNGDAATESEIEDAMGEDAWAVDSALTRLIEKGKVEQTRHDGLCHFAWHPEFVRREAAEITANRITFHRVANG